MKLKIKTQSRYQAYLPSNVVYDVLLWYCRYPVNNLNRSILIRDKQQWKKSLEEINWKKQQTQN